LTSVTYLYFTMSTTNIVFYATTHVTNNMCSFRVTDGSFARKANVFTVIKRFQLIIGFNVYIKVFV
jgi:hypothetical protein